MNLPPEPPNSSLDDALLTRIHDDFIASQNWDLESKAAAKDPAKLGSVALRRWMASSIHCAVLRREDCWFARDDTRPHSFSDASKLKPAVDSLSFAMSE